MAIDQAELAQTFLRTVDAQGDIFALLTDDAELMFPKWGVARGKAEILEMLQDVAGYVANMRHDPESFTVLQGPDIVCIEGVSSGTLVDGQTYGPDGELGGRFCVLYRFRGELITSVRIYLDPDYCDRTREFYPWAA